LGKFGQIWERRFFYLKKKCEVGGDKIMCNLTYKNYEKVYFNDYNRHRSCFYGKWIVDGKSGPGGLHQQLLHKEISMLV